MPEHNVKLSIDTPDARNTNIGWIEKVDALEVKEIRQSKGISRYELSVLSGVGESTLQNIENSDNPNPTFRVICKIADALEITLDELRRK